MLGRWSPSHAPTQNKPYHLRSVGGGMKIIVHIVIFNYYRVYQNKQLKELIRNPFDCLSLVSGDKQLGKNRVYKKIPSWSQLCRFYVSILSIFHTSHLHTLWPSWNKVSNKPTILQCMSPCRYFYWILFINFLSDTLYNTDFSMGHPAQYKSVHQDIHFTPLSIESWPRQ